MPATPAIHAAPEPPTLRRYACLAIEGASIRCSAGRFEGTIPGLRGVWAIGATEEEVRRELEDVVVDWALAKVRDRDGDIPILGDIDLNPD